MSRPGEESEGGSTGVLCSVRCRLPARRDPLVGAAGTRRRCPQCRPPIDLPRFARMRSCRRFRQLQRTARVAMSRREHGRRHSETVREARHVICGRCCGAASRPLIPRQNSFFVRSSDRHVLVHGTSRRRRADGRPERWHRPSLHRLTRIQTEVPS